MGLPTDRPLLRRVSLTGADDEVDPQALRDLAHRFPRVEWALLLLPEKEGQARNPTQAWRERFLDTLAGAPGFTALHLCGQQVFEDALHQPQRWRAEWSRYDRLQLNINARRVLFDDEQVLRIYRTLHDAGFTLILQRHEHTAPVIDRFLHGLDSLDRVGVLFDLSKGRGTLPERWTPTLSVRGIPLFCGHAGGLSPTTVPLALAPIAQAAGDVPYWIDMESGVRTDNRFDLGKAQAVLEQADAADHRA